jgi:hypothetical protein
MARSQLQRVPEDAAARIGLGQTQDLVVLVPGFLGFERLGGFAYFAQQIAALLRGVMEARTGLQTPVIPLRTFPAGSLLSRQRALLVQLTQWRERTGAASIHMVAHSAGGVDAYLLSADRMLDGSRWPAQHESARRSVRSIVTLATPFLGTQLATSNLAAFLADGAWFPRLGRELVTLAVGVAELVLENPQRIEHAANLLAGFPAATGLVRQLLRHRELIEDLAPARMHEVHARFKRELEPTATYFATTVPTPTPDVSSVLFRALYDYTRSTPDTIADRDLLDVNAQLLASTQWLEGQPHARPTLDYASNDGVVNTLRQLPPDVKASQVGALVVADHADMLGYFDRLDPDTGRTIATSIFKSGAMFREDQFFSLFHAVGRHVAAST